MKFFILMSLVLSFSVFSSQEVRILKIYGSQETFEEVGCLEQAQKIGNRLREMGVKVRGERCETEELIKRVNILISYESKKVLPTVSTYSDGITTSNRGIYKDKEQCSASLAEDIYDFTTYTRLTPFMALCAYDRYGSANKWFSHIIGVGKSDIVPQRWHWYTAKPLVKSDELFNEVKNYFFEKKIYLTHLSWGRSIMGGTMNFRYYAKPRTIPLYLNDETVRYFDSLDLCRSVVERFRQENESRGNLPLVSTYCSSNNPKSKRFGIEIVYEGLSPLRKVELETIYETYFACENSRIDEERELINFYGNKLVGSFCIKLGKKKYQIKAYRTY